MNVRFFAGTRAQYDSLPVPRNPLGLYFCEDTKELFWADRLLTDGMRVVPTIADLPTPENAADGVVYYVTETRNGYVVPHGATEWLQTIYAPLRKGESVVPGEEDNTVTTVGAVDEIVKQIYKDIDERFANIEVGTSGSGVTAIYFAGKKLDSHDDGTFHIDRHCALRALGFVVPDDLSEDDKLDFVTKEYVDKQIAAVTGADLSEYAKHTDLEGLASESYVDEKISEIVIPEIPTKVSELENDAGYLTQHQDLSEYAKKSEIPSVDGFAKKEDLVVLDSITAKEIYEVLTVPGLEVTYKDDEIRINTEHIEMVHQNVGAGGDTNKYYIGLKIYAPAGAESIRQNILAKPGISADKELAYFTSDDVDNFGRKYSTAWIQCGVYNDGTGTWHNYGLDANESRCLGYYFTVEWYDAAGNVITNDCQHIVFTNDEFHFSNVSDAVNRRFTTIDANVTNLDTTVANFKSDIENNYVQNETLENYVTNNYIEQNYTTTEQLAAEYVTIDKLVEADYITTAEAEVQIEQLVTEIVKEAVTPNAINYDTF